MRLSRKQLRKMINESVMQVSRSIYSDGTDKRNVVKAKVDVTNRSFTFMTPDGQVIQGEELRNHPAAGGNVTYILTKALREIEDTIIGRMGTDMNPASRIKELKRRLGRVAFDLGYDFIDFVNI